MAQMGPGRTLFSQKGEISPKVLPVTHLGAGIPQMGMGSPSGKHSGLLARLEGERLDRQQIKARLEKLSFNDTGACASGYAGRHEGMHAEQTLGHNLSSGGQAPVSPLVIPAKTSQGTLAPLGQQDSAARPATNVSVPPHFGGVGNADTTNGDPWAWQQQTAHKASSHTSGDTTPYTTNRGRTSSSAVEDRPQQRSAYVDRNDEDSLIPRALKAVVHRPPLPPSITPQGYAGGSPSSRPQHRDEPVQILPFLIVGSMKIAQDRAALVRMNISALMNCCSVDYVAPPQGSLLVSCSLDDADTSLSLQRQKAMDLISTIRQDGGVVLAFQEEEDVSAEGPVACWTGAICIMYLMWECRLTLFRAYALVSFQIPDLKISPRICAYLVHYEAILHGRNSMVLKDSLLAEILPIVA